MKKNITFLLLIILFSFFSITFAQSRNGENLILNRQGPSQNDRDPINIEREIPNSVNATNTSSTANNISRERISNFLEEREEKIREAQRRAFEIKERVGEITLERKEIMETRRNNFRENLSKIKEEQFRNRVEKLSENINKLNLNLSERYIGILSAMEIVILKIESRVMKIEQEKNIDMTSTYLKIEDAKNIINIAREEIAEQKAKEYIPEINITEDLLESNERENNINNNIQTALRNTHQEIKTDHNSLRNRTMESLRFLIREIIDEIKSALINIENNNLLEEDINNN